MHELLGFSTYPSLHRAAKPICPAKSVPCEVISPMVSLHSHDYHDQHQESSHSQYYFGIRTHHSVGSKLVFGARFTHTHIVTAIFFINVAQHNVFWGVQCPLWTQHSRSYPHSDSTSWCPSSYDTEERAANHFPMSQWRQSRIQNHVSDPPIIVFFSISSTIALKPFESLSGHAGRWCSPNYLWYYILGQQYTFLQQKSFDRTLS